MLRPLSFAALAFAAGCGALPTPDSSDSNSSSLDMTTIDPLAALEAETGQHWTARYRDDPHTIAYLEGRTMPLATTADDALRAGRLWIKHHRALFSMGASDDLATIDGVTDELGMAHAHFQEQVQGHPVFGGELMLHFTSDGALIRVNGRYVPITDELPMPTLTADSARVAAVSAARTMNPTLDDGAFSCESATLYIFAQQSPILAWRVLVDVATDVPQRLDLLIADADGSVVRSRDLVAFVDGSGIGVSGDTQSIGVTPSGTSFLLEDPTRGSPTQRVASAANTSALPGEIVKSKDIASWDTTPPGAGAAVDAQAFMAVVWDHFATTFERKGWADDGKGTKATVHFGAAQNLAFFDGKQLVFGDGDGTTLRALSGGLDVVAHEFAHGVIVKSASFDSDGQAASLREAFADIFACFVDGNWTIGETVAIAGPLRDLANPSSTSDATTMSDFDGNADPYFDSTIVSHTAYAMTQMLDPATVEQIFYRALTRYLWSSADFADAADATIAAANDLTPDGAAVVTQAWIAAGVMSQ